MSRLVPAVFVLRPVACGGGSGKTRLTAIAETFGEDSAALKQYLEPWQATTQQIQASGLARENPGGSTLGTIDPRDQRAAGALPGDSRIEQVGDYTGNWDKTLVFSPGSLISLVTQAGAPYSANATIACEIQVDDSLISQGSTELTTADDRLKERNTLIQNFTAQFN